MFLNKDARSRFSHGCYAWCKSHSEKYLNCQLYVDTFSRQWLKMALSQDDLTSNVAAGVKDLHTEDFRQKHQLKSVSYVTQ